jgi:putative membrane protein
MPLRQRLVSTFRSPRYPFWLLGLFLVWFAVWAIRPPHLQDFVLEHILTVAAVVFLCVTFRRFRLSNVSYTTIFLFLSLHVVGAHYTYSEVPYENWLRTLGGWLGRDGLSLQAAFGWERNHYDRLVHFTFGLLMAYPVREIFIRIARVRGFWGYYLPLDVMMSFSMLYELLEWAIAVIIAGDVGQSYLGTQGDEWDAHKDMALASLGALLTMLLTAAINGRYQRDFAAEFAESLRVARAQPLGEVRLAELRDGAGDAQG